MSTIGYGRSRAQDQGRARPSGVTLILMTMGITAGLTATLTSLLTMNTELETRRFPADLRHLAVGAVADAGAAHYLSRERV